MSERVAGSEAEFIDLTTCDREPIHVLGRVQSYGCLIALSADWMIRHASANTKALLGLNAEEIVGTQVRDHLPPDLLHRVRSKIQTLSHADSVARIFGVEVSGTHGTFDMAIHVVGRTFVLEFEPRNRREMRDDLSAVQPIIARIRSRATLHDFVREAAKGLSVLCDFDRVMVYKLDEDGTGTVMAEALQGGAQSYLNLRFPASDIPRQARALYERNLLRLIADVDGETHPIVPQTSPEGEPLDLSLAMTRAVSPVHIEYLRNMGVGASMSVSILRRGRLWGLFACHNATPHYVDYEARTAIELFAQLFSYELGEKENDLQRAEEERAQALHDKLMSRITSGVDIFSGFDFLREEIAEILSFDGIAIYSDGRYMASGTAPTEAEFHDLARFLNTAATSRVFATDCLSRTYEQAGAIGDRVAGLMALPISRTPRDYMVLFRREIATVIKWAGDPGKPVRPGPTGLQLSPRRSFGVWKEIKKNTSAPWTSSEMRAADALRVTLLEVVLKLSDEARSERARAQNQQELLIAELNHRVRNIFNLIRGLVAQGRSGVDTVEDFTRVLDSRIQALGRAHDQLTRSDWSWASLSSLFSIELDAFGGAGRDRVTIRGQDALLAPNAFTPVALVVHELVTNSVKYGALSAVGGHVDVALQATDDGSLAVTWQEAGGPPVEMPRRRGFGTTIIERTIPFELRGTAEVRFHPEGLAGRFVLPAAYVKPVETAPQQPEDRAPDAIPAIALSGEVLLVEDNMIIALDATDLLTELGAEKVHTAASVSGAMRVLDKMDPEIAILDVNLGSETSAEVATYLRGRGVPVVLATGYDADVDLETSFPDVPIVRKPYVIETLRRAVAAALGAP